MRAQAGLPEMESREKPRRKPDGGFCFFTITQLMMAWTALREAAIGLKELRVYFALAEMLSRRCGCQDDDPPPEFTPLELRRLIGGAGKERRAVQKLLAVGLLREVSKTTIVFATKPDELRFEPKTLEDTLDLIPNNDRRVPVPRRIVRLIAGGARRSLTATILGHLIRCLFYKGGLCHPTGCVKASWIAEVFGVSERHVHQHRQLLVDLGWLLPQQSSQHSLNRHGLWVTINLAWDRLTEATERLYGPKREPVIENGGVGEGTREPAPPSAENQPAPSPPSPQKPAEIVSPCIGDNKEPLRESNNQKLGTTGVYNSKSESKKASAPAEPPTLRDVKPEDLREPARLLELHAQAVAAGYVSPSEAGQLNFFAAANHARVIGSRNPPGLFARIVRSGLWHFCTQDDEDVARVELRSALYPERPEERTARSEAPRAFTGGGLSDDARFVRDITNVLRQRGIAESSAWRLVNRERSEWTRERWDAALAELSPNYKAVPSWNISFSRVSDANCPTGVSPVPSPK